MTLTYSRSASDTCPADEYGTIIATSAAGVTILDPVPDLLSGPAVLAPNDQASRDLLAAKGRVVQGVAADGVTQVVLRIPTTSDVTLAVLDENGNSGSTNDNGGLSLIGGSTLNTTVNAPVQNTASGNFAFALYRGPIDFVRKDNPVPSDTTGDHRTITLQVESNGQIVAQVPIKIVRPPVLLIHGVWAGPSTWNYFEPLIHDLRFFIRRVNYESTNYLGFRVNAGIAIGQIRNYIKEFKALSTVAAVQADVVAHSMGGDISRTFKLLNTYFRDQNYDHGEVHKLITLDTPHNGSPLAANLFRSGTSCKRVWGGGVGPISDAVRDLMPGSAALRAIGSPSATLFPLQAHLIGGYATYSQEGVVENNYRFATIGGVRDGILKLACPDLLSNPPGTFVGFIGLMGLSDLIVPLSSEVALAPNLGFYGNIVPFDQFEGYIHSVDPTLFNAGPDILNRNVLPNGRYFQSQNIIPLAVINLLNASVSSSSFGPISP